MRGIWTRITLASWLAAVSSAEPLFLRRTSSQHSLNWWHSRSRHLFQSGPSIALLSLMHETRRWFRCHDISLLTFAGFVQSYLGRKWWEVMHGWLEREGANDVDFCISTGHFESCGIGSRRDYLLCWERSAVSIFQWACRLEKDDRTTYAGDLGSRKGELVGKIIWLLRNIVLDGDDLAFAWLVSCCSHIKFSMKSVFKSPAWCSS